MVQKGSRIGLGNFEDACNVVRFCFLLHNMIVKLCGAVTEPDNRDNDGRLLTHTELAPKFSISSEWELVDNAGWSVTNRSEEGRRLAAPRASLR